MATTRKAKARPRAAERKAAATLDPVDLPDWVDSDEIPPEMHVRVAVEAVADLKFQRARLAGQKTANAHGDEDVARDDGKTYAEIESELLAAERRLRERLRGEST